jgi:CheY-like chemotaxis protein
MRLWLQRLARVEPRPILPASGAKQRILIVDDHAATREILKSMLEAWELEVNTAADEGEALRLMADSGRGFAAVLIDTSLGGSDGFQLAEAIRRNPQLPGSVVMMLPSPGDFEGATRCRQMELPAYVTKPVSAAELADAITRALHTPIPVMRSAPATELFRTAAPRHILIVEDEPVNRELATSFLKRWGHTVSIASSGEAALSALVATQFDAILMDVQMPGMSGLELTRRIREQEIASETHIPIIGISARVGREDRMASIEAGMDDYVAKPLSAPELFGAIERVAPLEASGEVFRADQEALLTAQEIVARVDGNVALACRIVTVFLDDTPPLIESLRDAVASRNGPEISGLAHRLKGAVANFPLDEAVALAARVEILGRRESYDAVDVTFEQLEDEIGDALVALQLALSQLQTGQFGT